MRSITRQKMLDKTLPASTPYNNKSPRVWLSWLLKGRIGSGVSEDLTVTSPASRCVSRFCNCFVTISIAGIALYFAALSKCHGTRTMTVRITPQHVEEERQPQNAVVADYEYQQDGRMSCTPTSRGHGATSQTCSRRRWAARTVRACGTLVGMLLMLDVPIANRANQPILPETIDNTNRVEIPSRGYKSMDMEAYCNDV